MDPCPSLESAAREVCNKSSNIEVKQSFGGDMVVVIVHRGTHWPCLCMTVYTCDPLVSEYG